MSRVQSSRLEQRGATLRSCVPAARMLRQRLEKRPGDLRFFMTLSALVFVLGLCMVPPALAQDVNPQIPMELSTILGSTPPTQAAGVAIGTLCQKLKTPPTEPTAMGDLKARCNEIVANRSS